MNITAEISLYPLADDFTPAIVDFILRLRAEPGIEVVTNQMSTQLRGEFGAVTGAIERGMRRTMEEGGALVFVVKYLNADLPIGRPPGVGA
jgi:uncharacterized protein YqgV (UPF0045/DUF77 family)